MNKKRYSKNRRVAVIAIFAIASICPVEPAASYAAVGVPISAPSAILIDQTSHRIIYSKTPNLRRAPASTTKLLTALVVMQSMDLNKIVTIPAAVERVEPSKIHLRRGERYRVRELLRAVLINSANDAAEALALTTAGSRSKFAARMNRKARSIGCRGSHFMNPSGLPASGQYSTAQDMALIMREFQKHPFLVQTLATRTLTITSAKGRKIYLRNHNKMLFRGHREVVGKTGWTRAAKHCFVGQISATNRKVFVAMLGSRRLWKDLMLLVTYQFGASLSRVRPERKIKGRKEKRSRR